jgi:adenylosuccinate synthase
MARSIVILSGRVAAGKTSLGDGLAGSFGVIRLKTNQLIQEHYPGIATSRRSLQDAGDRLDRRTAGKWIADALVRELDRLPDEAVVVVDSARRLTQVEAVRAAFGTIVTHIHLTAPEAELGARYDTRRAQRAGELPSYTELSLNSTERNVERLAGHADVVIDTGTSTAHDVLVRAATRLGLYGSRSSRLVDVVVGGQYGSEGKGHIVSYLAREYDLLVRVGGPNAGHTVMTFEGGTFVHHQLPSGTLTNPTAKLLIAPGAVLRVDKLLKEINDCGVDAARLRIDGRAVVIRDEDIDAETDLEARIGSTRQGVGAATARRIMQRGGDVTLVRDIPELSPYVAPADEILALAYARGDRILLEGTQGSSLSLYHGDYPFVTSRDTTVPGCLAEAGIAPLRVRRVVMVVRTYPIRVASPPDGTSGPIANEIDWDVVADRAGLDETELRQTEKTSTTRRDRRVGEFDWNQIRLAAALNGPTDIALTFTDYLDRANASARRFDQLTARTVQFIEELEDVAGAPVSLISTRFHQRSIIDRRLW